MAESGDLDLGALRDHLAASRRRGEPFEEAWRAALDVLLPEPDATARLVLSATRAAWAAAYERQPPRREHGALDTLGRALDDSADAEFGRSALLA